MNPPAIFPGTLTSNADMQDMNPAPNPIAVHPAALAPATSPRPTACPTLTLAAAEIANGTMNVKLTQFSAISCPASGTGPIVPIIAVTAAKIEISTKIWPPTGAPSRTSLRTRGQSRALSAARSPYACLRSTHHTAVPTKPASHTRASAVDHADPTTPNAGIPTLHPPGYVDPYSQFTDDDFTSTDPAVRARLAQIPTVTITGTDSGHADLRLERGAAISGRILYDDGSPAVGWVLAVIKPKLPEDPTEATATAMAPALAMLGAGQPSKTDDRGRYRISGLAPGEYALRASLIAAGTGISAANMGQGGSGINLVVYTGDTFNRADAKAVKVTHGDELTGIDLAIPSHKLHNISGHVVAKSDGHTLNVGQVNLTVKDNPAIHSMAAIRDDGSFRFEALPGNITYTLTVDNAADGRNDGPANNLMGISIPNPEILRKYGPDTTTVLPSDTDVDSITFHVDQTDWKPSAKKTKPVNLNPADLVKGLLGGDDSDDADKPK